MTFIIVMGVSGAGKSSIGKALSEILGQPFVEGDDLHSPKNIAKMTAGIPLGDEDRIPWLRALASALNSKGRKGGAIAACSALKREYRSLLRRELRQEVRFIHLDGDKSVLYRRLNKRSDHFMPSTLLESQFSALELPENEVDTITLDFDLPIAEIVTKAAAFSFVERKLP